MTMYYAITMAAVFGMAIGAAAATGLSAQRTPKAYIVTEVDVTGDMEVFLRDYAAHAQGTVAPFGGHYLARGGKSIVISEFPSFEKARAWRESPEYKKICAVREREANSRQYIVEGISG
jgi:uncharacterized protein (DUF1330 family)